MRIRTIKPEFFTHSGLYDLEAETNLPVRVAFAGLWCAADREGRFKWETRRLGVLILPYDGLDFSRVLDALVTRGFICKYSVDGVEYGCIPSFHKHQIINNRETVSSIPKPPKSSRVEDAWMTREARVEDASSTREAREGHACKAEGKGREGERKGKEVGSDDDSSPTTDLQWVEDLNADPGYKGIDVFREYRKMINWCKTNGKVASRRRFVNWLNRVEKPMNGSAPAKVWNDPNT